MNLGSQLVFLSKFITTLEALLKFHALTITTGNSTNLFVTSKLISLYDSFCFTYSFAASDFSITSKRKGLD
ncbi:hypothetical protein RJT34_08317 [Clitoria ternatea]|uniref:Uncharacterized protein n=1 Tax=Clitoria ternatea TaxID=43366 RepID=A0AAN9K5K2_CLITE